MRLLQIDDENIINLDQIVRLVAERGGSKGQPTTKIIMSDGASITASGTLDEVVDLLEGSLEEEEEPEL